MKAFLFLVSFLTIGAAQAGYNCTSPKGDRIVIEDNFLRGLGVKVVSKDVTEFYRKSINVEVSSLESLIDPETSRYLTEDQDKGYLFALQANEEANICNMWSLDFSWISNTKAKAVLMDYEGNGIGFELDCTSTPNLE